MLRCKIIIHFHNDESFLWVGPQGQQIISQFNKEFWVSEEEKDILQGNFPDTLKVLEEQQD
ncbi:hypothetical protein JMF94_13000 [Desulfovibrio sp. UIB00]|uniref:hypothetical protein n=1 Tax=Desulfovibrio sp. UIB00 TaxID=2804314 RepID=UPI001F0EF43B|nr:hypothetical protein [Desulfovibrio sp. UIB00]MCH5146001.1 hypothetical protein [Desulfovibrio sp. UIB00]